MSTFIEKCQAEARDKMAQNPQTDMHGFAYMRTDDIRYTLDALIADVVGRVVERVEGMKKDEEWAKTVSDDAILFTKSYNRAIQDIRDLLAHNPTHHD